MSRPIPLLLATSCLLLAPASGWAAVSRSSVSSAERQAAGMSHDPSISADGRLVAFTSFAPNLVPRDTNGHSDVFVRDRRSGRTTRVSVNTMGRQGNRGSHAPSMSSDGRFVAFCSYASNLAPGDTPPRGTHEDDLEPYRDVFVHDRATGRTRMVSPGSRVTVGDDRRTPRGGSCDPSIARAGRVVAYRFERTRLPVSRIDRPNEVWTWVAGTGRRQRLDRSPGGGAADGNAASPTVSDDGRWVAFGSGAGNLVAGDTNGTWDTFVASTTTRRVTRISRTAAGAEVTGDSVGAVDLSADGRFVLFSSYARDLHVMSQDAVADLYVKDRRSGTVRFVSSSASGAELGSGILDWSLSLDGRHAAFSTEAADVTAEGATGVPSTYLRDLGRRSTRLVAAGEPGRPYGAREPSLGAGAGALAYTADAATVPGDTNGVHDIFLWRP